MIIAQQQVSRTALTMETPIAAFHCRLCDIPLATSAEFRQHAKSESQYVKRHGSSIFD